MAKKMSLFKMEKKKKAPLKYTAVTKLAKAGLKTGERMSGKL